MNIQHPFEGAGISYICLGCEPKRCQCFFCVFLLFDPGIEKNVSLLVVTVDGGNIPPKKTKTNHKKKSYLTDQHTKIHRKDGPKRFNEHFAICVFFWFLFNTEFVSRMRGTPESG